VLLVAKIAANGVANNASAKKQLQTPEHLVTFLGALRLHPARGRNDCASFACKFKSMHWFSGHNEQYSLCLPPLLFLLLFLLLQGCQL